ncbi:amidase signature enzyme [Penicillium psychrosexuale]|uniref:amidase signature enzyme n=1 Tax=Penicillium psychrosexuale TaxID=1002107 RepID=UPI0025455EAD|nr:amidase signature enzyme [Penicillium psychrosexuale]KAJ5789317.1 amidase signature enzyme [Penicillium psychrosexuale]
MIAGTLKSTDLVEEYVRQIEEHNGYLRAVSVYAPGPLHGIPVLIKDTFDTGPSLEMRKSAGAVALLNTKPTKNAEVIDKLLAAGAVILGKTTISVGTQELSYRKENGLPCGWSAVDGQGQSPYIPGGFDPTDSIGGHTVPGGSSSGVSIAISAGLAAIGVGADTDASITAPAVRASLYSIRPTTGIVSVNGTVPCSKTFDTIGPMGRSVRDVADLLTALVEPGKTTIPQGGYASSATKDHGKIFRIGTLDPEVWNYPTFLVKPVPEATEQMNRVGLDTYSKIRDGLASVFHENVDLPPVSEFMLNGKHSIYTIWDAYIELVDVLNDYLSELPGSPAKSLAELVEWNQEHAAQALPTEYPSQDVLIEALNTKLSPDQIETLREHYLAVGSNLDAALQNNEIDIIVAPGDCFLTQYASAKGYPIAAVPISSIDYKSRPIGLQVISSAHREDLLVAFVSAFEDSISERQPPTAFLQASKEYNKQALP